MPSSISANVYSESTKQFQNNFTFEALKYLKNNPIAEEPHTGSKIESSDKQEVSNISSFSGAVDEHESSSKKPTDEEMFGETIKTPTGKHSESKTP